MDPPSSPAPRRRRVPRWLVELAAVLAVFVGLQLWQTRSVPRGMVPAIEGTGLDGEPLSTAALRGRPALVHFWATWCGVCRAEEGMIASLARDTPMVTVASSSGDAASVRAYLASRGIRMPVLVDPGGELATRLGVTAFPTTMVLGADGAVRDVTVGYTLGASLRARLWLAR